VRVSSLFTPYTKKSRENLTSVFLTEERRKEGTYAAWTTESGATPRKVDAGKKRGGVSFGYSEETVNFIET